MRNSVALLLGLSLLLIQSVVAQTTSPLRPTVPAALDVAGLHLVLNAEAQRLVQQKVDGLSRHQPSFQARVDLADASFPIIDRVLKEEGVPLDFRYLALQESALIGDARSNHEAVGYWQLKQETATGLGLTVNDAVDERQHLAASTRAAARYLSRNNKPLHNWLNALLSYYTGPAGVQPYTLPSDFDATEMAITEATSPYVLAFLAHKVVFEPACGLNPKPALLLQEFPAVAGQPLAAQAAALHVDPAALALHNRWLLAATVPADRPYTLIVPVGDVTQAAGILANQRLQSRGELLNAPAVAGNTAEVRINRLRALIALPGETMVDLARRAHKRLGEFLRHNEMTGFDKVVAGRPYYLQSKRDAAAVEYHVLQPGETVFDVAQKYGMRQKAVYNKNRMARNEELRPGRVLWLQHTRPRETAIEYRALTESVALERPSSTPTAAERETDALVSTANEAITLPRRAATESGQVKVKVKVKSEDGKTKSKRVVADDADGWGETLATAAATAAPVPVPTPAVAPAPAPVAAVPAPTPPAPTPARPAVAKATYLPPPAAAPAPAPLADDPGEIDSAAVAPAPARPTTVSKPAPTPKPAPAKAAEPAPTYPAVVAAKPVATAPVAVTKPTAVAPKAAPADATHRVEAKETVYSISRLYNIPPATLIAINQLQPPYGLVLGQTLKLKAAEPEAAPAVSKAAPVAKAPQQPAPAASQAPAPASQSSGRINPAMLYVPKKTSPAAAAAAATPAAPVAPASQATHTVAKGETLYSIARQYKVAVADLQAWNGKAPEDASAKIGEVLRVQAPAK
ncbi:LysM peptidoglycan-binding domain-containing protein [Hymenobacter properus]|uniref:LysM peptidoglycan-binding domain-containing protein n=1 Tax=Hymenobacter properus TaxID=2791026 RepID=A0A931BM56_9BACT|nr:LysM peptidoglycan-binding domain-containing protein [Hymenobacter properus]MBF9141985.1 LysM peptidoglycan-binding domain-containing protein [Hymenobacter properus]MBR7720792.1 LysM peptidoglycan-binding domain-containing protein [Microvirga sp. SRT04]